MIRTTALARPAISRREALRLAFLAATALAATELVSVVAPFIRVTGIGGLGAKVTLPKPKSVYLETFASTNDRPILFQQDKFFLLHAPGGVVAAYRKCTHLGCAVPFAAEEDRFHCPCHQSVYDKRTALLVSGPAPRGLDLFHVSEADGTLVVDTNPFQLLVRGDNKWHAEHVEVRD